MFVLLSVMVMVAGCSVSRFIPEGEYLLNDVKIRADEKGVSPSQMQGYVQQHPNSRWFSAVKVPMAPYLLSGRDTTKRINRFLQRIGQAPVIYSQSKAMKTRDNIEAAVRNMGFLQANVDLLERKKKFKLNALYDIHPGVRYTVASIEEDIKDEQIRHIIDSTRRESRLSVGMPFDLNELDAERSRINHLLRNQGYYQFNKEFVRFEADTTLMGHQVALSMVIDNYRTPQQPERRPHRQFYVGDISFSVDSSSHNLLRENVLRVKNAIKPGELYKERHVQETYGNLSALGAVMNSTVTMIPDTTDSTRLQTLVSVTTNKRHTMNAEVEGTNTSGDLGAAVVLSYQNRNLFRGSELLSVRLRGAYEAIKKLEGYEKKEGSRNQNYIEYGAEVSLAFPDFKFPGISRDFRRNSHAISEVSLMYNSQNRPEFHRRVVTGAWRYRWSQMNRQRQHKIDLIDLNYVFMPWISKKFREDLYYRLNVFPLRWLPLCKRPKDILPIAKFLLSKHATDNQVAIPTLSEGAAKLLCSYSWPGNVRELDNVMQRSLILSNGGVVDEKCIILDEGGFASVCGVTDDFDGVAPELDTLLEEEESSPVFTGDEAVRNQKIPQDLGGELKQQEYQIILDALIECRGSRQEVSAKLGISPRTLRYKIAKMRELGMIIPG